MKTKNTNSTFGAKEFAQGHMRIWKYRHRSNEFYEIVLTHKGFPQVVTDEITLIWQSKALAYLMAASAADPEAQRATWELYRALLTRLELEYVEAIAPENARKIYADIMQRRGGHPAPTESEQLADTGLRYLEKWFERRHGFTLTDEQVEACIKALTND